MRNTYKYTKLYSGALPKFEEGDVFTTTIPLDNVAELAVTPNASHEGATYGRAKIITLNQEKLLKLIEKNPSITKVELAKELGVSETAIQKQITALKTAAILIRHGNNRSGHWEINLL